MVTATKPVELQKREVFFNQVGYTPFEKQWYLHGLYDWDNLMLAGGVRFSKSWWAAYEAAYTIYQCFWQHVNGEGVEDKRFWLIGLDYSQTEPEWGYLKDIFSKLGMWHIKSTDFNGTSGKSSRAYIGPPDWSKDQCMKIETKSANNLEKIGGFPPMLIVLCEAAQNPTDTIVKKSQERLLQTRKYGSRLIIVGTFESSMGWYPQYYEKWHNGNVEDKAIAISCPSWENVVEFPLGREDPAILQVERDNTEEYFNERYGGVPCAPQGAVLAGHFNILTHVRDDIAYFDEKEEVFLWYDPGFTHPSAIMAGQKRNDEYGDPYVVLFDEVYTTGLVADQVIDITETKEWFPNVNRYGCTIDYHGKDHSSAGIPVADQWYNRTGIRFRSNKVPTRVKTPDITETGVDLLKRKLKPHPITSIPRLVLNSKCKGWIAEAGGGPNPLTGKSTVWLHQLDRQKVAVGYQGINDDCMTATIYGLWDMFGPAEKMKTLGEPRVIQRIPSTQRRRVFSGDTSFDM